MRLSLLIAVISLLIAGAMQVPLVGNWLMPDVPLWLAPLAAIWAFLTWWGRVLRSMNDAVGATVQSEMVRTVSPWAAAEEPAAHRARKSCLPTNCCAAACILASSRCRGTRV